MKLKHAEIRQRSWFHGIPSCTDFNAYKQCTTELGQYILSSFSFIS